MAVFIFGWQSSLIPMRFIWAFQALQKKNARNSRIPIHKTFRQKSDCYRKKPPPTYVIYLFLQLSAVYVITILQSLLWVDWIKRMRLCWQLLGFFLTEIILYSIGFWVSSLCKSYKQAMLFGFGALIVFYCIYFVAEYLCIPALFYLTPLKYFWCICSG